MKRLAVHRPGTLSSRDDRLTSNTVGPRTRRRLLSRLLPLLLFVPLITSTLGSPQVATGDELSDAIAQQRALAAKIAQQRQQVANLTAAQSSLDAQISSTRSALASISVQLTTLQGQVSTLTVKVNAVKATYAQLVSQLAALDNQLVQIEGQEKQKAFELQQRKDLLASRIRAAYKADQTSLLETVLSAQSFADVVSDVGYYIDIGNADKALADQIGRDQQALLALQQTVETTRQATDDLRVQTAAQKAKLDSQMAALRAAQARMRELQIQTAQQLAAQKAAMSKLAHNKKALLAAIRENGAAQAALKKTIDKLVAAQFANGNIPSVYNGTFDWPMGGAISQPFGCTGVPQEPPLGSCPHFHQGIDLVAPYGTPVHAAGSGVVVFVGYNPYDAPPQAWIVIIAHSQGLQTWYAHMQPIIPDGIYRGAVVTTGQVIGYEGSTGHSTGAHLHWAVELNGSFVNPRMFV